MSRRTAIGLVIFGLMVVVVVARYRTALHIGDQGRLHLEANGEKAPYMDVAVDRETLPLLLAALTQPTPQQAAGKYAALLAEGKILSVALDTSVRITDQLGNECAVQITSGKENGKSGWVPCGWIVK